MSGIFNDWALATICLREISRQPEGRQRLIWSTAALRALAATVAYLIAVAFPGIIAGEALIACGLPDRLAAWSVPRTPSPALVFNDRVIQKGA